MRRPAPSAVLFERRRVGPRRCTAANSNEPIGIRPCPQGSSIDENSHGRLGRRVTKATKCKRSQQTSSFGVRTVMTKIHYGEADVDGLKVFCREAGCADAPALLLLHGFPSAGHMFRDLIPALSDRFRIVAPDLPGFGQSDMPPRDTFSYTFDKLAEVIERFTEIIGLARFAVYVFDYGAPTGFRLAMRHSERIAAIISQNGNAYEEGLSDGWNPIRAYWQNPSQTNRSALRSFLAPETTIWQYTHGVSDTTHVSPDGYSLDNFYLARPRGRRGSVGPAWRLQKPRLALPGLSGLFPHPQAAVPGSVGQERSVLPAGGSGSVHARHPQREGALLRHRPFRAGDACRRDRG